MKTTLILLALIAPTSAFADCHYVGQFLYCDGSDSGASTTNRVGNMQYTDTYQNGQLHRQVCSHVGQFTDCN